MVSAITGRDQLQSTEAASTATSPKLVKAAHEFEAMLLQSWLEKMNKSFAGESGSLDPAHDTVSSLGTQAVAQALAARGGIGIANMILRQLRQAAQPTQRAGEVQANVPVNQVVPGADNKSGQIEDSAANIKVFSPIADDSIARQFRGVEVLR